MLIDYFFQYLKTSVTKDKFSIKAEIDQYIEDGNSIRFGFDIAFPDARVPESKFYYLHTPQGFYGHF